MSGLCTYEKCNQIAEIICDCNGENSFCQTHYTIHSKEANCKQSINLKSIQEADLKSTELINEMGREQRKIIDLQEQLLYEVKKYTSKLLDDIENSKRETLDCMHGNKKDLEEIKRKFREKNISRKLEEFMKAIDIVSGLNAHEEKPLETQEAVIQEAEETKNLCDKKINNPSDCISNIVNSKSLEVRKQYCIGLGLEDWNSDFARCISSIQEIKFTDDGKYVFVCKSKFRLYMQARYELNKAVSEIQGMNPIAVFGICYIGKRLNRKL